MPQQPPLHHSTPLPPPFQLSPTPNDHHHSRTTTTPLTPQPPTPPSSHHPYLVTIPSSLAIITITATTAPSPPSSLHHLSITATTYSHTATTSGAFGLIITREGCLFHLVCAARKGVFVSIDNTRTRVFGSAVKGVCLGWSQQKEGGWFSLHQQGCFGVVITPQRVFVLVVSHH
nr:hypothetical protein [Tanacetum cinerariifolium]